MDKMIYGVVLTPLKQIFHPLGDVFHAMKVSEEGFVGFGEVYFSTIHHNDTKIWKKHLRMTLNLVIPVGRIRFVLYDDRVESPTCGNFMDITLGRDNYQRITIPPDVWVSFKGEDSELNLLLNVANLEHDPLEVERKGTLNDIVYQW